MGGFELGALASYFLASQSDVLLRLDCDGPFLRHAYHRISLLIIQSAHSICSTELGTAQMDERRRIEQRRRSESARQSGKAESKWPHAGSAPAPHHTRCGSAPPRI